MTVSEFINMGGYGIYIWLSYLIATILFIGLYISAKIERRELLRKISVKAQNSPTKSQQHLRENSNEATP